MGQSSLSPSPVQLFHLVRLDLSKEGRMSSTVCYKCNRTGHFARECSQGGISSVGGFGGGFRGGRGGGSRGGLVIVAASAVVSHLATTATNPATLPVNAQNLEPRLATTAARTDTSLASATLLTTVAQAAMETATATATAAANLDTSLVTAPMVGQAVVVTPVIFA